jgi:hypothetical protein
MRKKWVINLLIALLPALVSASAAPTLTWIPSLKLVAYSLGWLMMVILGGKWIIADSPNERADAKKGMIYIVVGLLVVASACSLLCLYCDTADKSISGFKAEACKAGKMAAYGCAGC